MTEPGNEAPPLGFLGELRRRRVIRVAIVYAIAGWVVIEVASTMLPGLNLPQWTVTLVIALVVLGFPIIFLMGWMFDLGPCGVVRTPPAGVPAATLVADLPPPPQPDEAKPLRAPPKSSPLPPRVARPVPADDEGRRTIAVLPFVNMSGDIDNEYFSDGISEEILNLLTKLPQLKVASRTSSFNLKGEKIDIPTVARQLGVGTILEGSVRRAGERVRITAQLIETRGETHLWAHSYDRPLVDCIAGFQETGFEAVARGRRLGRMGSSARPPSSLRRQDRP